MQHTRRFLASTALAFSLGAIPAHALTVRPAADTGDATVGLPLLRVQMSVSDAQTQLDQAMAALTEAQTSGGDVTAAKQRVESAQAELNAAMQAEAQSAPPTPEQPVDEALVPEPEVQAQADPEPAAPEPPAEKPKAEEPAPQPEPEAAAPAEEPAPAPEAAPAPEEAPAAVAAPEAAPEAPAEPEAAPEPEQPAAEAPPAPEAEQPAAEAPESEAPAPAEEEAPAAEAPKPEAKPAQEAAPEAEQPAAEAPAEEPAAEAPAEEPAAATEEPAAPAEQPAEAAPAAGEQPAEAAPAEGEQTGEAPAEQTEAPAENKSADEQNASAEAAAKATAESTEEVTPEATLPVEGGAPVLDSAKEEPAPAEDGGQTAEQPADGQQAPAETQATAEPTPAPTSDAEAQATFAAEPVAAPNPLAEKGQRLQARPDRRPRDGDGERVRQVENRFIIQFNNQTIVQGDDDRRLRGRSEDVYYDELPRGRTREVITRRNGTQVVTIRNRHGEIIQRSKILPSGREIVLAYIPENERGDRRRPWRDPGRDLPPLRLNIPISQYVLDATVADEGDYYDFLEEPPVERVERIYSVDEVKYSARIRDKVRRIDMDTLTFETGSANIPRDQVDDLGGVADAISKVLDRNPGETFLIEGHTDAVGSDDSNLILSDERAETVANALSAVYGIPPENLVTQGYGERYLKVRTQGPERLNRRVTIRRITPLISPVASAQ